MISPLTTNQKEILNKLAQGWELTKGPGYWYFITTTWPQKTGYLAIYGLYANSNSVRGLLARGLIIKDPTTGILKRKDGNHGPQPGKDS